MALVLLPMGLSVVLTHSAWLGLVVAVLGSTLAYKIGTGRRGRATVTLAGEEIHFLEEPGRLRCCKLDKLDKVNPKARESVYEDEADLGMLVLILSDGSHLRVPEDRTLVVPYRQAEAGARRLLQLIRDNRGSRHT